LIEKPWSDPYYFTISQLNDPDPFNQVLGNLKKRA